QATQKMAAQSAVAARPARSTAVDDDHDEDAWWKIVGFGILLLAVSAYLFWYFSDFEATGGIRRMKWYLALPYSIGGKWLVSSIFGVLGIGSIALGIYEFLQREK
ncbi:MAG TPA: hypothetical protein VGB45_03020, partial [Abditibacterium sp.]